MKEPVISIVSTAFDEAENIELLVTQLSEVLERHEPNYEIVIVDNGSVDRTLDILLQCQKTHSKLRIIQLTRNFGHQGGILAGLSNARGKAIITMDADLQHPPESIPDIIKAWNKGSLIVNMEPSQTRKTFLRNLSDKLFYSVMQRISGFKLGQADFRLMDRIVVDQLLSLQENQKFIRGLVSWMGFPSTILKYDQSERHAGKSKFSFNNLYDFAFQGMTAFSTAPLKIILKLSIIILIPAIIYLMFVLIIGIMQIVGNSKYELPPGWLTLSITVVFFGAVQLFAIGILAEYIGNIFYESKHRPNFIIQREYEAK